MMTYIDGYRKISNSFFEARTLGEITRLSSDETLLFTLLHFYRFHHFENKVGQFRDDADVINALSSLCQNLPSGNLSQIYDIIRPDILNPQGHILVNFIDALHSISNEWYESFYPQLFDDLLFSVSEQLGRSGFFVQPKEFSDLIYSLIDLPKNAKVYDPFAGVASFGINLPDDAVFTGQEINGDTYVLALLRTFAHQKKDFTILNEDSFCHWLSRTYSDDKDIENYDLVVSFPPFGIRRDASEADLEYEWEGRHISLEEYFLSNGQCSLLLGGQMAGIFPPSILFQGGATGHFRENLVRSGHINTIIELPAGLLSMSSIGLCAIIFNSTEKQNDSIRFVDAKSFSERHGRKNILKVKELTNVIQSENPEYVRNVSINDIVKQDCILTPERFFTRPEDQLVIPEGFELVRLGDLFDICRGQASQLSECRVIKGRDLRADDSFSPIFLSNLDIEAVRNGNCKILDKECLLLLRIGQLKPTIFKPDFATPVTCNPNVTALKPKEDIFFPYVISELRKDYVKRQVEMRSVGVAMKSISQNDLLGISILMPCDRHLQQISFENEQRLIQEQKLKSLEVDKYLKAERDKVFEMMRIRRHRIKPYFSGMKSNLDIILEEVSQKGILPLDYELDTDYTILDAIRNIKSNLTEANRLFSVLTMEANIGEIESINLRDFIIGYNENHTIPSVQFKIEKVFPSEDIDFPEVQFNKENLKEVLDELVYNAEKHFSPEQKDATVVLQSFVEKGQYLLAIYNNGLPLPDDFDTDKAFNPGYHMDENGTGQGLFRLKQICDAFGAKITIERDNTSPWVVNFYIYFRNA